MNQLNLQVFPLESHHYPLTSTDADRTLPPSTYRSTSYGDTSSLVQNQGLLSPPHTSGIDRYSSRRDLGVATHYSTGHILSDSSSNSIDTSPSSTASSLAHPSYPGSNTHGQDSHLPTFNPFPTASSTVANSYVSGPAYSGIPALRPTRLTSIGDPSSVLLNPISPANYLASPPALSPIRQNYTGSVPGLYQYRTGHTSYIPQHGGYGRHHYSGYSTDPTRMMSTSSMLQSAAYAIPEPRVDSPPFLEQTITNQIICEGHIITPNIEAKIEKGFFLSSDDCWTCYRRNYFSVQCSYTLVPPPAGQPIQLLKNGEKHNIQALAVTLAAAVDGANGKAIDLVQHTPKRDKGPQNSVGYVKLMPASTGPRYHGISHTYAQDTFGNRATMVTHQGPYLPLQTHQETVASSSSSSPDMTYAAGMSLPPVSHHTFERIQFKSATANNGKRRAQQQYYHLIVKLFADIRDMNAKEAKWVEVAVRMSNAVVVRGRSPSHYQNEGPHSARNPSASSGSSNMAYSYMRPDGQSYLPGNAAYGMGATTMGQGGYARPSAMYTMEPNPMLNPMGTHFSNSSESSVDMMHDAKPNLLAPTLDDRVTTRLPPALDPFSFLNTNRPRTLSLPLPPVTIPSSQSDYGVQATIEHDEERGSVSPAFPAGGLSSAWTPVDYGDDQVDYTKPESYSGLTGFS